MEKIVWVIGDEKKQMIEAQRQINSYGSMRAVCMLTFEAVKKSTDSEKYMPDLIILDYEMLERQDFAILSHVKTQQALAGVPLFFMVEKRDANLDEDCYRRGAVVVVQKPFSTSELLRIERTAWQHEVTKNYEKMLQKQAGDLQAAREIMSLNRQLQSRNELLYKIFGRYFPDSVVDVILENPEGAGIGGEKKEMTVMMADLRGFTSISEALSSDTVMDLLNFYFSKMAEAIMKYHGTVIEFLGDAVLSVFGAPLPEKAHADNAVAAAITMQNSMGELNAYCSEHGYPPLEMGIGIHSGEAFIGNIGSEKMMRYNVIGKIVNECSRIESYSIGGQILVSDETIKQVTNPVEVHNRLEITAKGIQKPVSMCEVIGIGGDYQCNIENVEFDILYPVDEWVLFNMYPVVGKRIREKPIAAVLREFSKKRAVVETGSGESDLSLYTDVEIFAAAKDGKAVFTGVYAKVVTGKNQKITLHFTHVNRVFQAFADSLLENAQ